MDLSRFRTVLLLLALSAALMLVVVLAQQKRDLLARIEGLTARIREPYEGMYVPAMSVPSVRGDTVRIGSGGPGQVQVLFVFSTTCEFCEASVTAWKQIAGELDGNSWVEIVGVSVDSFQVTREYIEEHGLEFPVVILTDRKLRALYRIGITPQTTIIDPEGRVGYSHLGAVTEPVVVDSILNATWIVVPLSGSGLETSGSISVTPGVSQAADTASAMAASHTAGTHLGVRLEWLFGCTDCVRGVGKDRSLREYSTPPDA